MIQNSREQNAEDKWLNEVVSLPGTRLGRILKLYTNDRQKARNEDGLFNVNGGKRLQRFYKQLIVSCKDQQPEINVSKNLHAPSEVEALYWSTYKPVINGYLGMKGQPEHGGFIFRELTGIQREKLMLKIVDTERILGFVRPTSAEEEGWARDEPYDPFAQEEEEVGRGEEDDGGGDRDGDGDEDGDEDEGGDEDEDEDEDRHGVGDEGGDGDGDGGGDAVDVVGEEESEFFLSPLTGCSTFLLTETPLVYLPRSPSSAGVWWGEQIGSKDYTPEEDDILRRTVLDPELEGLMIAANRGELMRTTIENIIRGVKRWSDASVEIYGSVMVGTANSRSDVDLSLRLPDMVDIASAQQRKHKNKRARQAICSSLRIVGERLKRDNRFRDVTLIFARIPLIRCSFIGNDGRDVMQADLCFFNDIAVRNSQLIKEYCNFDATARELVMFVKIWAKRRELSSAANGTLSSYCWSNLAIYYLQNGGVLPNLQEVPEAPPYPMINGLNVSFLSGGEARAQWQPGEAAEWGLLKLVRGFFFFYDRFDWQRFAVSIKRGAEPPLKKCAMQPRNKNWRPCIEDPFERHGTVYFHDLACVLNLVTWLAICSEIKRGRREFEHGKWDASRWSRFLEKRHIQANEQRQMNKYKPKPKPKPKPNRGAVPNRDNKQYRDKLKEIRKFHKGKGREKHGGGDNVSLAFNEGKR